MFRDIKLFGKGDYTGKDGSTEKEPSKSANPKADAEEE